MEDRFELVASIKRYDGRDDLISWLSTFSTKYSARELKRILNQSRGKRLIWSKENVTNPRKASEIWIEKGVTIL